MEQGMSPVNRVLVLALTGLSAAICSYGQAADWKPQLQVGETTLVLNGVGSRSKAFIGLYESGLYLQQPSKDAAAIVAADECMAVRVKITSRLVSRSSLVSSLQEGLEKSTKGNVEEIRAETAQFIELLGEELRIDDVIDFVYVPSKGLYVIKNGTAKGVVPNVKFKQALFGIWLSDNPADEALKRAMLQPSTLR
jgi:hypothetical protein